MDRILSLLFPPKFHFVEEYQEACVTQGIDPMGRPLTEDGILWRAYDVRKTGIEKMAERGES